MVSFISDCPRQRLLHQKNHSSGMRVCMSTLRLRARRAKNTKAKSARAGVLLALAKFGIGGAYLRCLLTSLVISNIVTVFLPPKTAFNASSALMLVLFFLSWSPFFLI